MAFTEFTLTVACLTVTATTGLVFCKSDSVVIAALGVVLIAIAVIAVAVGFLHFAMELAMRFAAFKAALPKYSNQDERSNDKETEDAKSRQ